MELVTCPFCKREHFHDRPYLNVICHCGAKLYVNDGTWLNRKTGEKVKEPGWPRFGGW